MTEKFPIILLLDENDCSHIPGGDGIEGWVVWVYVSHFRMIFRVNKLALEITGRTTIKYRRKCKSHSISFQGAGSM